MTPSRCAEQSLTAILRRGSSFPGGAFTWPVLALALFSAACGSASDENTQQSSAGAGAGFSGASATQGGGGGSAGEATGIGGSSGIGGSAGLAASAAGSAQAGAGASGGTLTAGAGGVGGTAGATGGGGSAGSGDAAGSSGAGSGGMAGSAPNDKYLKTHASGYGFVEVTASSKNQIVSFSTTLAVPIKPQQNTGTLFLWPGLQPNGANFQPIDNGVLQPVLTWGPTCAPSSPKTPYASWWVSAQYVNTYGSHPGYTGCLGGDGMNVQVGDELQMVMSLSGSIWHQSVTSMTTQKSVSYDLDMLGQAQNRAEFVIEMYTENPAADVLFTATTITFQNAEPASCQPSTRGINDFFTNPSVSADGKQCSIDRIVLRAQGVPATSPN